MNLRKPRLGLTALLAACVFWMMASAASACWLCTTGSGSSGLDCTLEVGETGGVQCFINCKTVGDVDRCFCRTLYDCGGSNGCGGQPCPTAETLSDRLKSDQGKVFLTHEMYRALEASNPDVAMMLANFVKDSDAVAGGLIPREPFLPGEYHGLFTSTPTGRPELKETYRFEAKVTQEADRVVVDVRIFDHPSLRSLHAQIRNGDGGILVEIGDSRGRFSRIEM